MLENDADKVPNYMKQAAEASAAGDPALAMHLYLAAFEQSQQASEDGSPSEEALAGLKKAWKLACSLKERSMAEYVFERIEPYLSPEETAAYAKQLQDLALDKLEEYGLPREELEGFADAISQDLPDGGSCTLHVEHLGDLPGTAGALARPGAAGKRKEASPKAPAAKGARGKQVPAAPKAGESAPVEAPASAPASKAPRDFGTYRDLVGYDEAVSTMRKFGIGMDSDPQFQELVELLNDRHGLEAMPAVDSLLFRSPAREDANQFMRATAGELGLPVIRMRMEENMQGVPVLCVMAQSDHQPKLNSAHTRFEGPGVLILEDLDLWTSPVAEQQPVDDLGGFLMASLSRGAREAVALIQSAVDNSDVYVLASSSDDNELDTFFCDLLTPLSVVEIDYPNESERAEIWKDLAREHPSLRAVDRKALVRCSRSMPRYDIYMAVREAIEESYKSSLATRRYAPVAADNLFDKLAAYQPLDSPEYKELEDAVVEGFRRELEDIDDLLDGEGN